MKNPYDILGLNKNSSIEELEARYDELKAEYGEGRFRPGKEGLQAAQKLNDLEDAWRDIQDDIEARKVAEEKNATEEVKAEKVEADDGRYASEFSYVEKLIADKRFNEAQNKLDDIMDRNAEWHYLQSRVYYNREWYTECRKHLEIAIASDPDNEKYKRTLDKLDGVIGNKNADPSKLNNGAENNYDEYAQSQNAQGGGDSLLSCCATYCLLSCCCDMCRMGC